MELSCYDELLQQVETLKAENCNLRKELASNSHHLSKLENEASTMKEVLSHLHGTMDGRPDSLGLDCNPDEGGGGGPIPDNRNVIGIGHTTCDNDLSRLDNDSLQSQLLHLERERTRILQDIEAEEKEKLWFLTCLESINHQLNQLADANRFAAQNDDFRKQLEENARCVQETMQQKLGTRGEMKRREEARIHSISLIEKEIQRLYPHQRHQSNFIKNSNEHLDNDTCKDPSKGPTAALENFHSELNDSDEDLTCSKMTTSATQTVGMFSCNSVSPPPPTSSGDIENLASMYPGTWPLDKVLWHSGPSSLGATNSIYSFHNQDTGSVANFKSSFGTSSTYRNRSHSQQLGTKVEMVYSLLSMLGSHDKDDMSRKLLNMSASVDSCIAMRQSGCLPLLIELLHGDDKEGMSEGRRPSRDTRRRASQALHNIVHSHPDDKRGRREARVLRLLEQIRDYCNTLRDSDSGSDEDQISPENASGDQHPVPAMAMLMKLSFDEEHRHAMCQLGGLQAIAELVQVDYETHGNINDQYCITLRRYAGMALTNLTFGDGTNKALLCSLRPFMKSLVAQLHSPSEDLRQVIASVLRNLSWRADQASKKILREVGAVSTLMKAAVEAKKESTLKSILSALWNLSAHCSMNKADICAVDGALAFLVGTLTYKSPSKTHAIIENGGGILRNISSHIAVQEEYRAILRKHNCLQILLQHLRSPSLTIVSNACGTLWNLSARCTEDQQMLWDLGAVSMLRNLVHSKHKMISMGSSAALKNLLSSKPGGLAAAADKQKSGAPSLLVRKQKFLEAELDQNLSETCENLDSPKTSPTHHRSESELKYNSTRNTHNRPSAKMCQPPLGPYQIHERMYHSTGGHYPHKQLARSDSKESLISTRSDSSHDRLRNLNILLHSQKRGLQQEDTDDLPDVLSAPPGVLESRIQYVMQEVTRQIAMEKNEMVNSDCGSRGASYLKSASSQLKHAATSEASVSSQLSKCMQPPLNGVDNGNLSPRNTIYNKYSNLSSMIENLNLDDGEPVNYSLKYPEEAGHCFENKHIDDVSEVQLVPKVDNCVSNGLHSNDLNQNEISKKYCNAVKQTNIDWHSSHNRTPSAFQLSSNQTMYAHYAETDLDDPDQPTNYSLMYTEDTDTTDNFCPPAPKDERPYFTQEYPAKGPSIHDDTIKTYCTEDTPLNFSTATSLTDLREIKDGNCNVSDDLQEEKCSGNDDKSKCEGLSDQLNDSKQSETCKMVTEEKSGVENKSRQQETCHDKAVTYCVEGTPVSYSRVSSLSSIHSNDIGDNGLTTSPPPPPPLPPPPDNLQCHSPQALSNAADISFGHPHGKGTVGSSRQHQELCDVKPGLTSVNVTDKTRPCMTSGRTEKIINGIHEGKTVTFGEDHYAEETPLMFSRCSSLGSLSSFDQHSIHDDHSSVISDFSRRASEVVSPSDLPDSPGQTRPPSPPSSCGPATFTSNIPSDGTIKPVPGKSPQMPGNSGCPKLKSSVFEDSSHFFAEEGTPLNFSKATSLSSLPSCYDSLEKDISKMSLQEKVDGNLFAPGIDSKSSPDSNESVDYQETEKRSPEGDSQDDEREKDGISNNLSENDYNEEDILVACINSAMPNNTRHGKHKHNNTKLYSKINVLGNSTSHMRTSSIPVKASNLRAGFSNSSVHLSTKSTLACSASAAVIPCKTVNQQSDTYKNVQHKENVDNYSCKNSDTHSGPDSNSDTSSVFDDDNDKILAQCIQSGMPKASHSTGNSNSYKHVGTVLEPKIENSDKQKFKNHYCHVFSDECASKSNKSGKPQKLSKKQPFASCHMDSMTTFKLEGTPLNFSTNTSSLSDLTFESNYEDSGNKSISHSHAHVAMASANHHLKAEDKSDFASSMDKNLKSNYPSSDSKLTKSSCDGEVNIKKNNDDSQPPLKMSHIPMKPNVVPSNLKSTKRNQVASYLDEDEAKIYAVEDTPMISHGSSLSSLSGIHTGEESGRLTIDSQDKCEQHVKYQVEDTPVCFSRNSSLSSLSIESLGIEPTPLEQALLDECISSGMPKVRIPESSNERKSGKHKGNLLYCASVSKDNRTTNNRISHQMDSIQETVNIETDVKNNVSELNNSLNSCHEAQITHTSFETENPDNDGVSSSSTLDDHSRKICDAEKEKFEEKNCFPPPLPNPENDVSCLNSQDACSEASNTENSATLEADKAINLSSPSDHNVNELSTALLVEMEAARVVVEVQNEANKLPEEMDQSMVSLSSDLIDNINPPSVMGEILSGSMISSGASESLSGIHPSVRRGSFDPKRLEHSIEHAQINKSHSALRPRVVPELVMRALADGTIITKPPSVIGSMENLSMRSSAAGDLIDNIKPPSLMEDTDMASSTYSVCSIVSEIADSKSEGLDIDGSLSSDIVFRCLKPVVAMAELYARDGNMIASNRSNVSASEKIENVNPPSTFLEIIDTINDCTEVGTDTLENNNDTDVEDELPPDPEPYVERDNTDFSERPKPDDTICSMQCEMDHIQSEDNFNDEQGDLDITPEEVRVLREDARLILSSLNEIQFQELAGEESLSEDMLIECETLSLVSNESDSSHSTSESPYLSSTPQRSPSLNGGPRIVKPGNRDAQKQDSMSKEESRNGPKPIRGRRKALYPRQQVITPFSNSRFSSPKIKDPKVKEMAVKPTRTSALRATQSQQKVSSGTRVAPDTCSPVIPVQRRTLSKSGSSLNSSGEVKTVVKGRSDNAKPDDETGSCEDEIRPKPPIKQGTFTKDKPSQNSPPKISPTKTRIPTYGGTSPVDGQKPPSQNKDDRPPRSASSQPNSGNSFKNGPSKSFGEGKVATTSPKTITRTVTGGQQNNKSGVAKGSNSPVLQSQRSGGVASPRKVSNIRSSPSTHSLGGSNNKRGNSLITKVNGLYGTLSNAKRSSSNVSLSSNTSSSTSNSRKSSGCSSNKKEAQSKISSIWKSNNRMIQNGSGNNSPPVGKPKEGLSRSSTYEKLPSVSTSPSLQRRDNTSESNPEMEKTPPEDCPLQSDRSNKTESGALSSSSKLVTKETMKALAEARIQKWTDRKARILAKKASNEKDSTSDEHENSGYRTKEAGSPVNETSNFISTDHETSDGNLQSVLPSSQPCNNSNLSDAKGPTSAIVPPYNYTPSSMQLTRTSTKHHSRSLIPTLNHVIVSPNMRQKDTYIHSTENDIGDAKHPCMVTTV